MYLSGFCLVGEGTRHSWSFDDAETLLLYDDVQATSAFQLFIAPTLILGQAITFVCHLRQEELSRRGTE